MAERTSASHQSRQSEQDEEVSLPSREAVDTDIEDILDEIDAVLEENAEDFVKSFVQKGGQ
ncbi:MAG: Prokaryotic ubiquitin-like protein Pup [Actinomycetota bacterium]|jgi:ubiquitin-like protein Pup